MIKLYGESYKEYRKDISRKEWIKNWRLEIYWEQYMDVDVEYVEDAVTKYCEDNKLEFNFAGGWFCCISDRRQYNDIQRIINDCLSFRDEEYLEEVGA